MHYRRLGRTDLWVSVIGIGTCQLRLIPEREAIETLLSAFKQGVNLVHTAPDYEGAEDLVSTAVRESGKKIIVCSQGYGSMDNFERLFESLCEKFDKERLDLFGVACVDDREALGENLWGKGGMVEFLQRKKDEGRLVGSFCTTHGAPSYVADLIEKNVFDVVMLAYNPLGFHLLTYNPAKPREFESISKNPKLFPLFKQHDIGLMIMKPLAGGLLCPSLAFPPLAELRPPPSNAITATDILRSILRYPEVSSIIPGTGSVTEAEENASAGHGDIMLSQERQKALNDRVGRLKSSICSRCGRCEDTCSQDLPISLMFRAGYISLYPSETFETPPQYEYFKLHPQTECTCTNCKNVTCVCPHGIDIRSSLTLLHGHLMDLRHTGQVALLESPTDKYGIDDWAAKVIIRSIPRRLIMGGVGQVIRLQVENTGKVPWFCGRSQHPYPYVGLQAEIDGRLAHWERLRDDVYPGCRGHFSFELPMSVKSGRSMLTLRLVEKNSKNVIQRSLSLNETLIDVKGVGWKSAVYGPFNLRAAVNYAIRLMFGKKGSVNMKNKEPGQMSAQPIYGVHYRRHNIPKTLVAGTIQVFWVEVENRGTKTWVRKEPQGHNVDLVLYWDGKLQCGATLPDDAVSPGESAILWVRIRVPDETGRHVVAVDMVEQNVTYFADQGVDRLEVPLQVVRKSFTAGQNLANRALSQNESFFWPTQGVTVGTKGFLYPAFAERAEGCFITDVDGRRYVDYVMGWGSAWLGYAHPDIQNAIRNILDSAAIPTLAHRLEMEVTGILCDEIPCAEKVLFGKNGSDVCTAAVRLARAATGRRLILVSGYHGWQDWYLQSGGFASPDAVPEIPDCVIHFRFNDAKNLEELLKQYKGQVAAVMLEPGAAIEGLNGPVHNVNVEFLSLAADITRREGALLIFDEIFTGFRYPGGSVQKALDIIPDLACFGKALGGGMPLSALVGSRSAFAELGQIYYGPSFKGEVYSLAAARAALNIYRTTDVVSQVWSFGDSLRQGLNDCCRDAGVSAEVVGPPIRMVLSFREDDPQRIIMMRTLLQQELLKAYIITYKGFMLPSLGHDEAVLKQTLEAFSGPLKVLAEAIRNNDFVSRLEVPPMV